MNNEEAKQYLRFNINSCIKTQSKYNKLNDVIELYYNKSYIRALKISKIIGKPVNKEKFKDGNCLFFYNAKYKYFWASTIITNHLIEYYSKNYSQRKRLLEDVLNEYDEYKDYSCR